MAIDLHADLFQRCDKSASSELSGNDLDQKFLGLISAPATYCLAV